MPHSDTPISRVAKEALASIFWASRKLPPVFDFACESLRANFPKATKNLKGGPKFKKRATKAIAARVERSIDRASRRLNLNASRNCITKGFKNAHKAQKKVEKLNLILSDVTHERERYLLLRDFNFIKTGEGAVQCMIPAGVSIMQLIDRVESFLSKDKANKGPSPIVFHVNYERWSKDSAFTDGFDNDTPFTLQAVAEGTLNKSKQDQSSLLQETMAQEWQVVAAFLLNYVASHGEDLFAGFDVRTAQHTLYFSTLGLKDSIFIDEKVSKKIGAAKAIAA